MEVTAVNSRTRVAPVGARWLPDNVDLFRPKAVFAGLMSGDELETDRFRYAEHDDVICFPAKIGSSSRRNVQPGDRIITESELVYAAERILGVIRNLALLLMILCLFGLCITFWAELYQDFRLALGVSAFMFLTVLASSAAAKRSIEKKWEAKLLR
jgi:hypothetical protein